MDNTDPISEARADRGVVVGVDIGGSKIALMASEIEGGEDLARDRFPTPAEVGPDALIEQIRDAVLDVVERSGRRRAELRAVGVAVPGQVDPSDGRVILAGNLKGWVDVPLRAILSRELGVPVWVEQDASAAAFGERWRGCAVTMSNFVFLVIGTGIGAGLVIDGRLHRGCRNAAGEVGNFVMGREYLGKARKGHGNLETLIGSPAIKRQGKQAAGKEVNASEAIDQADEDSRLQELADRFADHLGMAVINIAALLDPEAIVFGGGGATAGDDLLERLRERLIPEIPRPPALIHSVLGEDAQLHGAIYGALQALDADVQRDQGQR